MNPTAQWALNHLPEVIAFFTSSAVVGWVANALSTVRAVRNMRKGSKLSLVIHGVHELAEKLDKE